MKRFTHFVGFLLVNTIFISFYGCVPKDDLNRLKFKYSNLEASYDSLKAANDSLKKYIEFSSAGNANDLILRQSKKALSSSILKRINVDHDDIKQISWFKHKTTSAYETDFYLYFGKKQDSNPWLRLYIRYYGDDWLFVEKYIFRIGERNYTLSPKTYGEIQKDNSGGSVWEILDRNVTKEEYAIIHAIINSDITKMRFEGDNNYKDITITNRQKQALRDILTAYTSMGGNLNF